VEADSTSVEGWCGLCLAFKPTLRLVDLLGEGRGGRAERLVPVLETARAFSILGTGEDSC